SSSQRVASQATICLSAVQLLGINASLPLGAEGDLSLAQIEAAADRWIQRPNQCHRRTDSAATRTKFIMEAKHWLSFLKRLRQEPGARCPDASLLAEFAHYMEHERGWSPQTIRTRCLFLTTFVHRVCDARRSFADVSIADNA